jgi:nitroreductase
MTPENLTALIQNRRSVFPAAYNGKPIEKDLIENILDNARFAPTHRITEPWRFKVMQGDALVRLSEFLGVDYDAHTAPETWTEMKRNKFAQNPTKAACIIAICVELHPDLLPEWEEIASVSAAVQNMWLTCTAHGIGSYWSSPGVIKRLNGFLGLGEHQKCLGLFYMGYADTMPPATRRSPVSDIAEWL